MLFYNGKLNKRPSWRGVFESKDTVYALVIPNGLKDEGPIYLLYQQNTTSQEFFPGKPGKPGKTMPS